jgi:hypothetical protein
MLSPSESLRMCVGLAGAPLTASLELEIVDSLVNILKNRNFYPVEDICTTQGDPPSFTITATFFALKKTPEKNGVV